MRVFTVSYKEFVNLGTHTQLLAYPSINKPLHKLYRVYIKEWCGFKS